MTRQDRLRRRQQAAVLLRRYVLPERSLALLLFIVTLLTTGLELALPLIAAAFIDGAIGDSTLGQLRRLAVAFLLAALAFQVMRTWQAYVAEWLALNTTNRLRADLTRHCLGLDMNFHQRYRPGDLVERIEGDVGALGRFMSTLLVTLLGNALLLIGVLGVLFVIDWRLGAVLTGFVVVICLVLNALRDRASPLWEKAMQADSEQSGFVGELLDATEDVRSAGAVPFVSRRFTRLARDVLHRNKEAAARTATLDRVTEMLFMLALATGLGLGSWLVLFQGATIGTIYLIYRYGDLLGYPIYRINDELTDLQRASAAVGRVSELFANRSRVVDGAGEPPGPGPLGVEFDRVTFGYDPDHPVLHEVSFGLRPGLRLGVVGRTGSGKTTISRLLVRLFDPDRGTVRLGGVDLRDMAVADVRRRVGLVTQDVRILYATVRDNLTLFDPSVPDEHIVRVLSELGFESWLDGLPDGLDTPLAVDGGLSAGEAQMLALARVFMKDPQVVVFDEATSRLDPATERAIDAATGRLLEGRTALVIAHRLETIERMDEVLVLDGGRVVEHGERPLLAADPDSRLSALLRVGLEGVH